MILIRTDCYDLAWNLALEYYFSMEKKLGDTVFVLWQADPTVIIGKYQNLRAEVDLAYTEANNIRIVRRLSGGGAVYADRGNVMYTFLEPAGEEISFAPYLSRMRTALRGLGYPAEISGRNDLLAEGRKFSGNSQYIREGMCVHHGTLLYDSDLSVLERATTPSKEKLATKGIRSVRERVCNLREFTPERTVEQFVDEFLPTNREFYVENSMHFGPSPYEYFIGNPKSSASYGCMAPVIEKALRACVDDSLTISNLSGASLEVLCDQYIDNDIPVILWATIRMLETNPKISWYLSDGTRFTWPGNEHCMLLVGYDDTQYYFNDPYTGKLVAYDKTLTEDRFAELGRQAVVVFPR